MRSLPDSYIRNADSTARIIAASLFLHPGLIFIDSIHFQYNGMLLGILLLSLVAARDVSKLFSKFRYRSLTRIKEQPSSMRLLFRRSTQLQAYLRLSGAPLSGIPL
jgi:hypothetical protein